MEPVLPLPKPFVCKWSRTMLSMPARHRHSGIFLHHLSLSKPGTYCFGQTGYPESLQDGPVFLPSTVTSREGWTLVLMLEPQMWSSMRIILCATSPAPIFLSSFSIGIEPRALHMLGKCSAIRLHPQPCLFLHCFVIYEYKSFFAKWTPLAFCLPCDGQYPCPS